MLAIVEYGVGNLFSLKSSLAYIGQKADIVSDGEALARYDSVLLPGVGAFCDAARKLLESGLEGPVLEHARRGKPLLGVCLGMQLLLERSYEYGEHCGLGLIPGSVRPLAQTVEPGLKIPQMGWNGLLFPKDKPRHPLFAGVQEGDHVYFVHSYQAAECEEYVIARTEYGGPVVAAIARDNVCGTQFHPEKSGDVGLAILRAFCRM